MGTLTSSDPLPGSGRVGLRSPGSVPLGPGGLLKHSPYSLRGPETLFGLLQYRVEEGKGSRHQDPLNKEESFRVQGVDPPFAFQT